MRACNWQVNRPCAECFASMARTTIAGEPKPLARSACPPRSGHSATTGLVLRHDRSGAATRPICPRPWCRSGSTCSRTSMGQRVRALVQQNDSLRGIQNATPAQRHSGQRVGHDTRAIEITSSSSRSIRSEISLQPDLTIHQGCMIQTTTTLSSTGHAPVV